MGGCRLHAVTAWSPSVDLPIYCSLYVDLLVGLHGNKILLENVISLFSYDIRSLGCQFSVAASYIEAPCAVRRTHKSHSLRCLYIATLRPPRTTSYIQRMLVLVVYTTAFNPIMPPSRVSIGLQIGNRFPLVPVVRSSTSNVTVRSRRSSSRRFVISKTPATLFVYRRPLEVCGRRC